MSFLFLLLAIGVILVIVVNVKPGIIPKTAPSLSKDEARLILGVDAAASVDDIKEAHRRLIQKNHPDTGGNPYLAAKINQARDVLLQS